MKLQSEYSLDVQPYDSRSNPLRLSVGDVIRCERFRHGLRFNDQHAIMVGFKDSQFPEYHASAGNGQQLTDDTRAEAPFFVVSIECSENSGPADSLPESRLSADVQCLRLTDEMKLLPDAELIRFSRFEPMSVAQPPDESIELIGYASMPIGLND